MKSFKDFANNIVVERVVKTAQKPVTIDITKPILPMQGGESGVSQAEVSKTNTEKLAQRALDKKRAEAIKKGYVDPTTGRVQERGVVTNRIRAAALGYGDAGKDPTKYGINPGEVAREKSTLFQRAVDPSRRVRRAARSEIRAGIQSIEKRYPGATVNPNPTPFRGFSARAGYSGPSRSDLETLQRQARPTTSTSSSETIRQTLRNTPRGKAADAAFFKSLGTPEEVAAAAQDAAIDMQTDNKSGRTTPGGRPVPQVRRSNTNVVPPTPPAPTPAKVQPRTSGPKVTTNTSVQSWQGPTKAEPAPVKQPVATKAPVAATPQTSPTSSKDLAKQIGKEVRKTLDTNRAATRAASTRAWTKAGKGLGILGAGLEGKYAYDTAKAAGASTKRAVGAGLARAAGGLLGAAVGAVGGSVAGPVGSIAGGTLGYTQGADKATKLYNRITGDPNKKVTTQSVIRNVGNLYREKVPTSVRAKVPEGVKRTFKDFMLKAGRQYGNWQRSQSRQEA